MPHADKTDSVTKSYSSESGAPRLKPSGASDRANKDSVRLTQLDALRGLAALAVFLGHSFGMMPIKPAALRVIYATPLRFFCDGHAAVLMFFVLSGFVLMLKYVGHQPLPGYWPWAFIVRRLFRIYPAFLASVALALALRFCVFQPEWMSPFSNWFSSFWQTPLSWPQVARLASLVGPNIDAAPVNPPLWSLVYEMRISIVFPLLILALRFNRHPGQDLGLLLGTYLVGFLLRQSATCVFLPHFVLGAVCAKYSASLRLRLAGLDRTSKVGWLVVALAVYGAGAVAEVFDLTNPAFQFLVKQLIGLGAAAIILACVGFVSVGAMLRRPWFQFIGKTSYGFYLNHQIVMFAVAPLLYRLTGSFIVCWMVCLALAYGLAELVFRFIEAPGIRLGSRLGTALTGLAK